MKKSTQTVPYNAKSTPWKKFFVGMLMVAVPVFVSCEKDPVKPDNNNGNNQQPQKHNVELKYNNDNFQNISMDTINKYHADPAVDTIFLVVDPYNSFNTVPTQALQALVNRLRKRHDIDPKKVLGKGKIEVMSNAVANNPEIPRFLTDTMQYQMLLNNSQNQK